MTWEFETSNGTVRTDRVSKDVTGSGKSGTEKTGLRVLLDDAETVVVEEALTRMGAVTEREVQDGTSFVQDTSGGDNEVTVRPSPGGDDLIEPGVYAVEDFETEWRDKNFYEVILDLALVSKAAKTGGQTLGTFSLGE